MCSSIPKRETGEGGLRCGPCPLSADALHWGLEDTARTNLWNALFRVKGLSPGVPLVGRDALKSRHSGLEEIVPWESMSANLRM